MPYNCKVKERKRQIAKHRRKKANAVALVGGCCEMCGYDRHPAALQFHHLGDKAFTIGKSMSLAFSKIVAEVSKCRLLCGNCHAIVTCEESRVG